MSKKSEIDCCSIPGCLLPFKARGLCDNHYHQQRRLGELQPLKIIDKENKKLCKRCHKWKLYDEFDRKNTNKDGLFSVCKICRREAYQEYKSINEEYFRTLEGTKICDTCKIEKSLDEFTVHVTGKLGRSNKCRNCSTKASYEWRNSHPVQYKATRDAINRRNRVRKYGITEEEFEFQASKQDLKCGICKIELGPLWGTNDVAIDHDPITSKPRGILCTQCNVGLGNFKESFELLNIAINYLKQGGVWGN